MQAILEPKGYIGMGRGVDLAKAPFRCEEGVHQGAVESGWLFSLACNNVFQKLNATLKEAGGGAMAIIDDNYSLGPPELVFNSNKVFALDLSCAGLELQPAKSKCYIRDDYRDDNWNRVRGDIPNGTLTDNNGNDILFNG